MSAKQKKLTGNRSKKAIRQEASLAYAIPRIPRGMNHGARRHWEKWAPHCVAAKTLNPITEEAFGHMCDIMSRLEAIRRALDEVNASMLQERNMVDSAGREVNECKESAYSMMYRQYSKLFLDYAKQFHLTPSSSRGVFNFDSDGDEL